MKNTMTKRIWLLSLFLTFNLTLMAQTGDLFDFNRDRLQTQRRAMLVLGSWAVGNMAIGTALQGNRSGEDKYFHRMNIYWNTVNLTLAGIGYYSALKADPAAFGLTETLQEQHSFQKILLFNAGLDVGYIAGGLYLMERARRFDPGRKHDRLRGFGKSIIMQGSFLFLFDLATYFISASDNDRLAPLLSGLHFDGQSIGWTGWF